MKKGEHILIVDDEVSIRGTLGEYFAGIGYEIAEAASGEEALQKLGSGNFSCIISDLCMPCMSGIDLLKQTKLHDPDILFFIMTGFPEIDSVIAAMKEGASDYITKPFRMEEIQLKVERALAIREKELSLKKARDLNLTLIILIPVLISLGIILGIFWKGV